MDNLEPRQIEFLKHYLDPKSKTFSNALQSALKAGYSQEYSENITNQCPNWLSENLGNAKLLSKALKNIEELLDEKKDKKVKADITKFVVSRQGKDRGWAERQELSNPNGEPIGMIAYPVKTKTDEIPLETTTKTGDSVDNRS